MSKLSELESQAVKEGISLDTQSNVPSDTPASAVPAESAPASQSLEPQVPTPVKSGQATEDNVPFHKHPRFQELTKQNREFKDMLSKLQNELSVERQVRERLNTPQGQQIPQEQKEAIIQLARLFKQVPEFQQELGLNRIDEITKQNEEMASIRSEESFNKEFEDTLNYAVSLGLDKEEISAQLLDAVQNHPIYSTIPYKQGMVRAVFRDSNWDKLGQFKERELNAKLIKEQELKRKSNAETSSPSTPTQTKPKDASMEQFLNRRIKEEGGIVV